MTFRTVLFVLAHAGAVLLVGWCLLSLVEDRTRFGGGGWEWPERALFAIVAFVGFSWALMVVHLVLGGAAFRVPFVVPAAALAVVAVALRRRDRLSPGAVPWAALAGAALVLGLLYVSPSLVGGSGLRTGDPPWHLGWTEQLLGGEPVPVGPAPDYGRNAYPWGFHAVLAAATRLVPGSEPLLAHEALHLLIVAGIPLAAACLARRVDPRAGWAAAAAVALVGGFGWISAGSPTFSTSPSLAPIGADLTVASPNSVYELLPPAFPRELGLVILGATATALARTEAGPSPNGRVAAGVVAGLAGLVSLPMLVGALLWMLLVALSSGEGRWQAARRMFTGAFVVLAPWAGPTAVNYLSHGGFVNVTPRLGMEWPLPVSVWSWGLLLPAAAAGVAVVAAGSRLPVRRVLLACAGGTLLLLLLALLRGRFDWGLAGNATVLHQGRVWPPAHLLAAVFAGIAARRALVWLAARRERVAATLGAAVLAAAVASPVYASIALTEIIRSHRGGFVFGREDLGPDGFVRRAAAHLSPGDVVAVERSNIIAFLLFAFSGARVAEYDDARLEGNDLRIRYRDLAKKWDEQVAGAGFRPTWRVVPAGEAYGVRPVEEGRLGPNRWALIRAGR